MRILLAEDDDLLGLAIKTGLEQQGFHIDWVRDGFAALRELTAQSYEAAVLDLGMPRMDGMEVLASLRQAGNLQPILVLTARDALASRIQGLDMGADDYVLKPVDLFELAARLRALVRRSHQQAQNVLTAHGIVLDPVGKTVQHNGQSVDLNQREFEVLHMLMRNSGRILSRSQIEAGIYAWGTEVASNAVEVHISHLRRKLCADCIETVRGLGYKMAA